ncbi:MAG TPA: hypothetical protein VM103_00315 [Candidatus Paceibacterota bacterium]|nr:hypothetical protein [Candidatus Paceibacterota bacterium]
MSALYTRRKEERAALLETLKQEIRVERKRTRAEQLHRLLVYIISEFLTHERPRTDVDAWFGIPWKTQRHVIVFFREQLYPRACGFPCSSEEERVILCELLAWVVSEMAEPHRIILNSEDQNDARYWEEEEMVLPTIEQPPTPTVEVSLAA